MPFTGSHPAAVLPLMRLGLPASALVVGSMSPDIPYFLRALDYTHGDTHSLAAVFGADLLLGLALWAVWHGLLVAPALAGAPAAVRSRCAAIPLGLRARLAPKHLVAVVAALVVGSITHVTIDAFTHQGSWGAQHVPFLARRYLGYAGVTWAQVICSALGLLAIAAYLAAWWRRTAHAATAGSGAWRLHPAALACWVAVGVAACAGAVVGALSFGESQLGLRALPFLALTRAGTVAGLVALAAAAVWHARRLSRLV